MSGLRRVLLARPTGAAVSVGVSVAFAFFFLRDTDFGAVGDAFTEADVLLILLALGAFFAGTWMRAVRWHYLLRPVVVAAPQRLYPIMAVGYASNNILPLRTGEIVRAHTLHQQLGVSRATGLSNVFLERVFDGLMLTIFLCVGVAASLVHFEGMAYAGDLLLATMAFLVFGVTVAFGGLCLIASRPARAEAVVGGAVRRLPGMGEHDGAWIGTLIDGLRSAGDRSLLTAAFWASAIAWGLEALMYFLVGEAFGLDQPFPVYLLIAGAANVIITAPSTSGGVGPFEWAAKEVLLVYLVADSADEVAIAYAASLHGLVLIPITLVGLSFLWLYHVPLRRLARGQAERAVGGDGEPPVEPQPR